MLRLSLYLLYAKNLFFYYSFVKVFTRMFYLFNLVFSCLVKPLSFFTNLVPVVADTWQEPWNQPGSIECFVCAFNLVAAH